MNDNEPKYICVPKQIVYDSISADINATTIEQNLKTELVKSYIDDRVLAGFQD